MTKNIVAFGILACIIVLQTGCTLDSLKDVPAPCGDPLDYYNVLPDQTGNKLSTTETSNLPVKSETEACFKLREAIRLSMPGNKQQNDKEALVLLKDLKRSGELSESDLRFNNMLLQHVSQRQNLRKMIGAQEKRLKKAERQLDQLKNIEAEIDKKERSITSPIDE